MFVDTSFNAGDSVLPAKFKNKHVQWKRPGEISGNPHLFLGDNPSDAVQGDLGNCWFVSSMSLLANAGHSRIQNLVVESDFAKGRHVIQFYKNFKWEQVEIDDLLPCETDGSMLFAKCVHKDEFWAPLVEKAYAKMWGGYPKLETGKISDGLRDLTGNGVGFIRLDEFNKYEKDKLWAILKNNGDRKFPMGCAISTDDPSMETAAEKDGLIVNHAYGLTRCIEYEGHKLLRLRNPWAKREWNGAWSDDSKEITEKFRAHVGHSVANDGIFFMELNDFLRFNIVYVIRLSADGKDSQKYQDEWKGKTAAGFKGWLRNPQYSLTTSEVDNRVSVCLSQLDQREDERLYREIGIIVLQTNGPRRTTPFQPRRDQSIVFDAQPGETYVIIPCTYDVEVEMTFEISVHTDKPATIEKLPADEKVVQNNGEVVEGMWIGEKTGGKEKAENPQFSFVCSESKSIIITLEYYGEVENVGVFVYKVEDVGVGLTSDFLDSDEGDESYVDSVLARKVELKIDIEAGKYCLIACTENPKVEGRFRLSIPGVKITPI